MSLLLSIISIAVAPIGSASDSLETAKQLEDLQATNKCLGQFTLGGWNSPSVLSTVVD